MSNSNYKNNMPHYDSMPFNCNPSVYTPNMAPYGNTPYMMPYGGNMPYMPGMAPYNNSTYMPGTIPYDNVSNYMPGTMSTPAAPGVTRPGVPFIPENQMPDGNMPAVPTMPTMPQNGRPTAPGMPQQTPTAPTMPQNGSPTAPTMPQTPTMPATPGMPTPQNGIPAQITCEQLRELMRRMNCNMENNTGNTDTSKINNKQNKAKK